MENPLVSAIITTKNEENNIGMCLKSIKCQSYKNIEIIVVDNKSSDKTKEIASAFTDLIYDKGPERSAQRNYGVSICNGEYIMYLDADMILAPFVVESCIDETKIDAEVAGLYIKEVILGRGLWSKVRRFERSFYDGTPIDAVRFIKKRVFLEIKGFDEGLSGPEDWDFNRRVSLIGKLKLVDGYKVNYNSVKTDLFPEEIENMLISNDITHKYIWGKYNNAIFHNESNFNFSKYLIKKAYYMKDFDKYIQKWGSDDPVIKKQFSLFYRYFRVFNENGNWKNLLRHPILTVFMYFLKTAVGIRYVKYKFLKLKSITK